MSFSSVARRAPTSSRILLEGCWTAAVVLLGFGLESVAGEPQPLTRDGRLKRDPVFAGSDGQIVYTVEENPNQLRLMELSLADHSSRPVHPQQTKSEFEPALSADGRYLAFVQSRGNLSLALVIEDRETGKQVEVPPGGGFSGVSAPAVAPTGTQVLFSYAERGRQHIFSVDAQFAGDAQLKDRRPLIESEGINNWPGFSPDGKQLVFASTRGGNYDIYVCRADGTEVRQLTTSSVQDIRPRFAPDGRRVAFTSGRDGNYEIYVVDISSGRETRVTEHPERDDFASWHPDGKHLVLVAEREGKHDLYLLNCE